jgi:CHAD domain-containing protein
VVFALDTNRRVYNLSDGQGPLAEIAVDDVVVPAQQECPSERFFRVEVEVVPGGLDRATRFVDLMVAAHDLTPSATSKFQAALEATSQQTPAPDRLGSTAIRADMTAGEVAFAVMRKHFGVFLANEGGTRVGDDIEALHDMRVAARRLRAAMSAFSPYLSPRIQPLRAQLGWVAAALGEVRDLDVQVERMAEWRSLAAPGQEHSLDAVEAIFTSRREAARRRMLAVLNTRRYDLFVERFSATQQRGPVRNFPAGNVSILAAAPELLEKRYRRFCRQGDPIGPPSPPEAYHALRIEAKKLRYALEFVGPIYGAPATDFSAKVTALQDVLGLHQDADVAVAMLTEMATSTRSKLPPATILTMGAIAERYRIDAARLRGQFPSVYKPLRGRAWKQLRVVIEARRRRAK